MLTQNTTELVEVSDYYKNSYFLLKYFKIIDLLYCCNNFHHDFQF